MGKIYRGYSAVWALSLFSIIFLTLQSKAQEFGLGISPEISYRNAVKTDFAPGIDQFIDEINKLDEPILGFRVQALFLKNFAPKMYFETGASFARHGYNTVLGEEQISPELIAGLGSFDPGYSEINQIEYQYRFHTIGIPLRLVYISSGESVRFTWALGVTPEYLLESNFRSIYSFSFGGEQELENEFEDQPNQFNLMASLSAGVELGLNRKTALRIEPVIRYGLLPLFDEEAYEINLLSYGLSTKLFFTP